MARKPVEPSRAKVRAKRPPNIPPPRIRMPSASRVVTARVLRPRKGDTRTRMLRREVPEIRLSGAWLERVGFAKGTRFLISVEKEFRTIILQGSFEKRGR